jgi:hypothetical protein
MIDLIDCSLIISKHYQNLLENSNRLVVFILFFVFPTLVASILVFLNIYLTKDIITNLLVAFTIFSAFLPNVIIIQIQMKKSIEKDKFSDLTIKLSKYLYTDSIYALLISIFILIILLFIIILIPNLSANIIDKFQLKIIASIIIFSLVGHFLLTFLMVIQRLFILFFPEEGNDIESE